MNRRGWRRRIIVPVVLLVVAGTVMEVLGMRPNLLVVAGLVLAVGTTFYLISDVQLHASGTSWSGTYTSPARRLGADYRVNYLRRQVEEATGRRGKSTTLVPTLYAVASDRLRETSGVDLRSQPDRARTILGAAAVDYLLDPDTTTGTDPVFLSDLITRIENL